MPNISSRRSMLKFAAAVIPLPAAALSLRRFGLDTAALGTVALDTPVREGPAPAESFPSHPPELVREMVLVSHFNLARVKEIVEARPALARAAYDWGFGDWEDALGAASHMGNRAIAEYLIAKGARPSIFSAAMLGQLDVVRSFMAAQPGAQRIRGPHSISLLAHARVGGQEARSVYDFLQSLDGADQDPPAAISPDEAAAFVGSYVFGVGVTQEVAVDADMKMYANSKMYSHSPQLNWTRKGTMPRPLFHVGDHTFYPAGAPAVRIRFTQDNDGIVMTVNDPDVVLTARRKKA